MDDDQLAQLLHDAVPDAPPATFDADDVLTTSRRLTARRRSLVRGASMAAVMLLAAGLLTGLGVVGLGWFGHTVGGGVSSAGPEIVNGPAASPLFGSESRRAGPNAERNDVPATPPMQGGGVAGSVGPSADNTPGGCGSTDGELAVALAGELPSVGGAPTPTSVPAADCPSDARSGVAYAVRDNGVNGVVVAVLRYGTDGTALPVTGPVQASARTRSGNTITVLSQAQPAGGATPFAAKLPSIANSLATQF